MANLIDYHGPVSKCTMCLPAINIHKQFCGTCFGRGYVALCLNCDGKGKTTVPVGGSIGTMDSTCTYCGGKGVFPASAASYTPQQAAEEIAEFPLQGDSEKPRLLQPADVA